MSDQYNKMPKWVPRAIILAFGIWIFIELSASAISKLSGFLTSIALSLFLSFMIEPAVNWLAKRGWKRGVATFTVFFGSMAVILIFVILVGNVVVKQTKEVIDNAPEMLKTVENEINKRFDTNLDFGKLIDSIKNGDGPFKTNDIAGTAFSIGSTAIGFLFQMLTVSLFTFYMVADAPKMRRTILRRLPQSRQIALTQTWELAINKTGGFIYSRIILATASATFHFVAFRLIGVKYALVMAMWVGIVSQFIPVIGTYLAGALPVIVALAEAPIKAVWVLIAVIIYQQIENYLISPRITAKTMSLHPAISFAAVIVGASLFGPLGAFISLPVAAMIQAYISSKAKVHDIDKNLEENLNEEYNTSKKSKRKRSKDNVNSDSSNSDSLEDNKKSSDEV